MAVYSALHAMVVQFKAESNESMFSTCSCQWEFENQLNAAHRHGAMTCMTSDLHMTHSDQKLDQDY